MHEPGIDDEMPDMFEENALEMTWITKDQDVMTLGQMDDNHLRNATNMVGRQLINLHKELEACFSCLAVFQGEMAIMHAEQSADHLAQEIHELTFKHATMLQACDMRDIKL